MRTLLRVLLALLLGSVLCGAVAVAWHYGTKDPRPSLPSAEVARLEAFAEAETLRAARAEVRADSLSGVLADTTAAAARDRRRADRAEGAAETTSAEARRLSEIAEAALAALGNRSLGRERAEDALARLRSETIPHDPPPIPADLGRSVTFRPPAETTTADDDLQTRALTLCTTARRSCLAALDSAETYAEARTVEAMRLRSVVSLQDARHGADTLQIGALHRALDTQRDARALETAAAGERESRQRRLGRTEGVALASLAAVLLSLLTP